MRRDPAKVVQPSCHRFCCLCVVLFRRARFQPWCWQVAKRRHRVLCVHRAGMNLIFSPVYAASTGAADDAETDVEAAKDAADFGSVKSMPLVGGTDHHSAARTSCGAFCGHHVLVVRWLRALLPCKHFHSGTRFYCSWAHVLGVGLAVRSRYQIGGD